MPNAKVRISRPRRASFDDVYALASDEQGMFRVRLPKGEYVVRAELNDQTGPASLVTLGASTSLALTLDPPPDASARIAAAAWARRMRIGMSTTDPKASDKDLVALDSSFVGAQVVGLGESTHGSRETFQLKHRVVRWLVERRGFTTVALEANRGDVHAADDFVQLRSSDERAAVQSLGFWSWRTAELLELLRWLRSHNAPRAQSDRVRLVGIDMQSTSALARSLAAWVRGVENGRGFLEALTVLENASQDDSLSLAARQQLVRSSAELESFTISKGAPKAVQRDARVLKQALDFQRLAPPFDFAFRERSMADNMLAELDSAGTSRLVIWAHAGHVARGSFDGVATMGEYIAQAMSAAYRPVLVTFRAGGFRAIDAVAGPDAIGGVSSFELPEAASQMLEAVAASDADHPVLLDMRFMEANAGRWFDARVPTRWCGAAFFNQRASTILLAPRQAFDAVIVSPWSSPSLPVASTR